MSKAVTTTSAKDVQLAEMQIQQFKFPIIGDSSLIVQKFPEKALREIEEKQQKRGGKTLDARDPEAECNSVRYILQSGGDGFPAIGLKHAIITSLSSLKTTNQVNKTLWKQVFFTYGMPEDDFMTIKSMDGGYCQFNMRTDIARIGGAGKKISIPRYRPEYKNWFAEIKIAYNVSTVSLEQLLAAISVAGFGVGLGEWRPEKNGQFGRFHVATQEETKYLIKNKLIEG